MDCQTFISSDEYADLLIDFPLSLAEKNEERCVIPVEDNLSLVYQRRLTGSVFPISRYRSVYLPDLYAPVPFTAATSALPRNALEDSGIAPVSRPPLSLSGLGTTIAVIDTGIDYANDAFRNEDGTTRILAVWDQGDESASPPAGLPYGTLYTRDMINKALLESNPYSVVPTRDLPGRHGTQLAAIAAGSRNETTRFTGAAPLASLLIVKLKPAKAYLKAYYGIDDSILCYEESDLIAALKFVSSYTTNPLSILLGVGTSYGDHNGNSLLERYIDRLSLRSNLCITCPAGNEATAEHHYRGSFRSDSVEPVSVEFSVEEETPGFLLQFHGSIPNRFSLSLRTPSGEEIRDISYDLSRSSVFNFLYSETILTVDSVISDPYSGEEAIYLNFRRPETGIWRILVTPLEVYAPGYFDLWLPVTQLLSGTVTFLEADPFITLTAPSMATNALCVSAASGTAGLSLPYSGRGYLKNGAVKPDFSAPGADIETPTGTVGGTAPAAALVCGAASLFLEWSALRERLPLVNGAEIKALFIRGAKRSPNTAYPNPESGYGELDLENVLRVVG
ncbi:MAG: S8 family peptidase [Lachnospiraceae bacterium]|nr:S8 family peptidase [Lachnospiraceae bacterium]